MYLDVVLQVSFFEDSFESRQLRFIGILSHTEIFVDVLVALLLFFRNFLLRSVISSTNDVIPPGRAHENTDERLVMCAVPFFAMLS